MASSSRTMATVGVVMGVAIVSLAVYYYKKPHRNERRDRLSEEMKTKGFGRNKPQENFQRVLADNSSEPFVHLQTEEIDSGFTHPYENALRSLLEDPRLDFDFMKPSKGDLPAIGDPPIWIQTVQELEALAQKLSQETEFAVDTEQHSIHSLRGFTALVQISTQDADYLVDSIALHDDMSVLGPVFADPAICKLFHGADSDVLWLQRDFHIYVVNMFDTAKAARILGRPERSLASLLQTYCGVTSNKIFQRADWRIRPLPRDMLEYARTDTQYLRYIAHKLCMELIRIKEDDGEQHDFSEVFTQDPCTENRNQGSFAGGEGKSSKKLLEQVVYRSNMNCLQLYEKDDLSSSPNAISANLISRFRFCNPQAFRSPSQMPDTFLELVAPLCRWRDHVARKEDESLRSVLSDNALLALAFSSPPTPSLALEVISTADELPGTVDEGSASMVPAIRSPSLAVEKMINDLCEVINKTSTGELDGAELREELSKQGSTSASWFSKVYDVLFWFKKSDIAGKIHEHRSRGKAVDAPEFKSPRKWSPGLADKRRMQFVKKFSCKAPVYHNCRIYADDGRLLCFCDRKKLEWYVQRGLAEYLQDDPPAIRLLFEPKGRPEDEGNDFYVQRKSNQCVGCGESSHYLRYRIIPSCYRQHFPEHLKSHRSHDIVLLCVDCHEIAHKAAEKQKQEIATIYDVPLLATKVDVEESIGRRNEAGAPSGGDGGDVSLFQLKTAAVALLRYGSTIPKQRREELEKVLHTYFGMENISEHDLRAISLMTMGPQKQRRFLRKGRMSESTGNKAVEINDVGESLSTAVPASEMQDESSGVTNIMSDRGAATADATDLIEGSGEIPIDSAFESLTQNQNGLSSQSESQMRRVARHKYRKHDSFLGHGLHGQRVVEILLQRDGEEGIRKFSQHWRRVFVDALHPTFLPPGWDIFHSGRREFGDFSVYKPVVQTDEGEQVISSYEGLSSGLSQTV